MSRFVHVIVMSLAVMFTSAGSAFAASDKESTIDARMEGYGRAVALEEGSTATAWMLLVLIALFTLGVLFKNANRSHLD